MGVPRGGESSVRDRLTGLYVITDALPRGQWSAGTGEQECWEEWASCTVAKVRKALAGGAALVQMRLKDVCAARQLELGGALRAACGERDALFLVNDRCDLAAALDADGVHLGLDDLPIRAARQLLGKGKVIGATIRHRDQAQAAEAAGADYVCLGPLFRAIAKAVDHPPVGLAELVATRAATTLPLFVIGGIGLDSVAQIAASGADGIAVISAVMRASDPELAARDLSAALRRAHG